MHVTGGGEPAALAHLPGVRASTEQAFVDLYRQHFPKLAGYCQRLVGDEAAAHDIAQESFTRLFSRWRSVRDPRTWVYFVATNLSNDHWRDQVRQRKTVDAIGGLAPTSTEAADLGVRDVVERLPERLRVAVLLHYYADLPVEQVAAITRRPLGTVKRRLHEARALLAEELR